MLSEGEVIAAIDEVFGACEKPAHFTNYKHCEECAEHDELLRNHNRASLEIEHVGNLCWCPIPFASAEGVAYYFTRLARLSLDEPTHEYGWYAETLAIHLSSRGLW